MCGCVEGAFDLCVCVCVRERVMVDLEKCTTVLRMSCVDDRCCWIAAS